MKKTLPPPRAIDILFLKTTLHKGAIAFFNSSPHQETLCVNPIRSLGYAVGSLRVAQAKKSPLDLPWFWQKVVAVPFSPTSCQAPYYGLAANL